MGGHCKHRKYHHSVQTLGGGSTKDREQGGEGEQK